jgi:transcriptional regulator with XRE-family HTH domain
MLKSHRWRVGDVALAVGIPQIESAMIEGRGMLVQKLRLRRGWSQEQLAQLSGLSVRTIQRIENGQAASLETQKALASVFEIDLAELREPNMETLTEMPTSTAQDETLALAQVREIKQFYLRLIQYAVIVAILAVVNLATYTRHYWFLWVALFWGLALLFRGLRVFQKIPFLNAEWEKRQVERALGRQL